MTSGTPGIQPPPPPGLRRRVSRWWRSRDALSRLHRWLLLRALPLLVVFLGLYVLNGALIGWTGAYNVLVGIDSPGDVSPRLPAWLLSIAGWAAIPALVGGAVGYGVTAQIQAHRTRELTEILEELRRRSTASAGPDGG
ncbi:DUF6313 family protein [Streptomyces lanatus]|uniref:DUF6313 family protein n=1 Tax=Streptomyces lanatus TaxID=66900 RepID=A0ABV1XXY7_9ACTN|nr:DUF6313 family protein [Streptomyces lanatus]GHG89829.1 hypothetical protein GCM10018780_09420 [Streptomyces lanatus]